MYLLTMYQKLMFGPLDKPENKTRARHPRPRDLGVRHHRRRGAGAGHLSPQPILSRSEKSVNAFITGYRDRLQDARRDARRAAARLSGAAGRGAGAGRGAAAGAAATAADASRPEAWSSDLRRRPALRLHADADPDRHGLRRSCSPRRSCAARPRRAGLAGRRRLRRRAGRGGDAVARGGARRSRTSTRCWSSIGWRCTSTARSSSRRC